MTKKPFDCVEMKSRLQASMLERYRGLSDEEARDQQEKWLRTSDNPVARKWREITELGTAARGAKKPRRRKTTQRRVRSSAT